MPTRVIRQQMSLRARQVTELDRLAASLHRPKAELVRDAVDQFLRTPRPQMDLRAAVITIDAHDLPGLQDLATLIQKKIDRLIARPPDTP